jgi:hypothetical protein
MAFDFRKEYKEFYLPALEPALVDIPEMRFVAVRGKGDPNAERSAYQAALNVLYAVAYTVKMSYKGDHRIDGFFEYVVPPLEGFWWMDGMEGMDYAQKDRLCWISAIRLPDFVGKADFIWAVEEAARKKRADLSAAEYFSYREGLCVQCMHIGPFDDEPATICRMDVYAKAQGYETDISDTRFHHEIYLTDVRKSEPAKWRTVVRHPLRKAADR